MPSQARSRSQSPLSAAAKANVRHSRGSVTSAAARSPSCRYVVAAPRATKSATEVRSSSAAAAPSPAAMWCRIASSPWPSARYHRAARDSTADSWSGAAAPARGAARPGRGGGTGTTRAARPAAPRTGRPGPARRAPGRIRVRSSAASQSGPDSRSSTDARTSRSRCVAGQPVQHLGGEVVEDVPVVAADRGHRLGRRRAPPHRQRGQLQPGGPALGPLAQRPGGRRVHLDAADRARPARPPRRR